MADPDFISYLWPHAVAAGEATGIDPRIIAGQAAVESNWGRNFVGNNLFGIKGPGVSAGTTEVYGGVPVGTTASFRSFATPADSVGGYVDLVTNNPRYGALRKADGIDAQLRELGRSGYATDPAYATKVRDAASAIDGVVRKTTGANWSGSPGTPTDIKTALGYTGTDTMPTAARAKVEPSSFFDDLGIDPKGGSAPEARSSTASAESSGSSFFADMGIVPTRQSGDTAKRATPAAGASKSGTYATPMDQAAAVGIGMVDGIPIAGPYMLEGAQRGGAAIRALRENIPYTDALEKVRGINAGVQADNPYSTMAGNVAGAVGAYGLGAAAGGAKLLGMAGGLPAQIGFGSASGTAIGAADAAARGENLLTGAGFGTLGGALGPVAGRMAGAGVNKLMGAAEYMMPTGLRGTGISPAAASLANTVINADGQGAVRNMLTEMGPLGMIADAGPSSRGLTGGLVLKPSEARSTIENALTDRAAGANSRLTGDINAALGPSPVPSRVEAAIQANREALGPEYQRVMQTAGDVNTQPLADAFQASIADLRGPAQDAMRRVRGFLNAPNTSALDRSPQALLSTRQAIDGMIQGEANPQVVRQLSFARQAVDDELSRAVPAIKGVDAKYAELMRQSGALRDGANVLDSGKTVVRPQELADQFAASANPEGALVGPSAAPFRTQQGARGEIDRLVGTKANDLVALKGMLQGEGGWNTNKLMTVFGEEPTNRLLGSVGREANFANTTNEVLQNSATARRQAAGDLLKETQPGSMNFTGATTAGVALQAAKKVLADPIIKALIENPTAPRNLELARIMTAQGATRDQILDALLRFNRRAQAMSASGNLLTGFADRGANLLLRGAGTNGEFRPTY